MSACFGAFRYRGMFEWREDGKEERWVVSICQVENIDVRGVICDDQITSSGFSVRYLRHILVTANLVSVQSLLSCNLQGSKGTHVFLEDTISVVIQ